MRCYSTYIPIILVVTMFLPLRLLAIELQRSSCLKQYHNYLRAINKLQVNSLRIKFLENCKQANIIPHFLKFRVPTNGCFDDNSVKLFQRNLLKKEIIRAKGDHKNKVLKLEECRNDIKSKAPTNTLPSIILYSRINKNKVHREQTRTHNKKLEALAAEQEHPLFSVDNTVVTYELENTPPDYVMKTLALGPKNAVLDQFDPKDILAELDGLLEHCKNNEVSNEIITDINVKTLNYIKKCKRMKSSRNIILTKKYLKDNNLLAIPFDKGVGICIMSKEQYETKLDAIINLPQFEEVVVTQKNGEHWY